ncbi:MAG: RNA degradosome polyphosphate kinase, partial [Lentisphaerae bacterium]|nr:RNA degradosome polyphosphate kinase [Lentisphaerota bacterium]
MAERPKSTLTNRELSWLEFNQRVLDEADSEDVPILDRLAFLSITASNLDEFFMVRVGGLELLKKERITTRDPSHMTPAQQLREIGTRVHRMVSEQYRIIADVLTPALAREGVQHLAHGELDDDQRRHLLDLFEQEILPVVTPMALRPGADFPILVNLGLYVAVRLPRKEGEEQDRVAVIPLPPNMGRFVTVPSRNEYAYVLVEEVLETFIDGLFPGEQILEVAPFRITRNADLTVDEDFAEDFVSRIEEVLAHRKDSDCVRLEVRSGVSRFLKEFLAKGLAVPGHGVYTVDGPLDLAAYMSLAAMTGFDRLRYDYWPPQTPARMDPGTGIFDELSRGDILLYHPFDSFDPVVRLVTEAASDPNVLAIKQSLYRTGPNSPIISGLRDAAE